jgi:hypothetical protein
MLSIQGKNMSIEEQKQQDHEDEDIVNILRADNIENIYFNEFALGVSKNDVFILLSCNGKSKTVLNLSHVTAKSLGTSISEAMERFEEK